MESQMNCRKYGPGHAASPALVPGEIPEQTYGVLTFKPFKRDKIHHNRYKENPDAQKKLKSFFIF